MWLNLGKGSHTLPLAQAKRVSGRKICILFPLLLVLFVQPLYKENQWKKRKIEWLHLPLFIIFPSIRSRIFTQKYLYPSSQSHNSPLKKGAERTELQTSMCKKRESIRYLTKKGKVICLDTIQKRTVAQAYILAQKLTLAQYSIH